MVVIEVKQRRSLRKDGGKENNVRGSDTQWDSLVLTLRVSRALGIAPVKINRNLRGCPVVVFAPLRYFGPVLIAALDAGILVGLVLDLMSDTNSSIRVGTPSGTIAYILELIAIFLITTPGIFGARTRMERCIQYLNILDKINSKTAIRLRKYQSKKGVILTALYIFFVIFLHFLSFLSFCQDAVNENRNGTVPWLYLCYFVELVIHCCLELQFMWMALFVESTLNNINQALEDLIDIIDLNNAPPTFLTTHNLDLDSILHRGQTNSGIPPKSFARWPQIKGVPETFRRLVVLYGAVCDVIAGVNDCFGLILVPILASVVLHLVVTPFYLCLFLHEKETDGKTGNLILQPVFIVYHLSCLLLAVEPGNMTIKQYKRTQKIANEYVQRLVTSECDPLEGDASLLITQIEVSKAYYTPMNMFILDRELIIKVMSAVTTYLVIIFQFQNMDTTGW